ncbi:MAG: class I SAM-dependent methyltransferase [Acidobacteria bacterium]|nr:class I SAM-dependent methyltransferase [Acidobacteriota bacterium]MBV9069496.1 class I SAM-dependent methyltransferase [Acidobacteriota bacterium]MBV9184243.1 class I SAM-dependent methyltransferase [Acidobacteriota bacterium]
MTPNCLVCGAETRHRFDAVVEGFALFACDDCGSARTWPALDGRQIAAWYPQAYYGNRNVRFNPLFERMTRWFRRRRVGVIRRLTKPGAVLDVGCGRGFTLRFLADAGYRSTGVELSADAAAHARDVLGIDIRTGDFLSQSFEAGQFDVVIFWHSLEHVADPLAALNRAAEILKPGGLLVVAVPNLSSIQARLAGREWFHLDVPRHYVHFSARGLKRALRDRHFRIVDTAHFSFEQNPYGWIQSILNRVFAHDLLYSILKEPAARAHRIREYPLQTIATSIAGVLLLPVAMILMTIETLLRRGGTIEVYARKEAS